MTTVADYLQRSLECIDNAQRCQMDAELVQLLEKPAAMKELTLVVVTTSHPAPVRTLGAALLRQRVSALWKSLSLQDQEQFKSMVIQALEAERQNPPFSLMKPLAHLIIAVAQTSGHRRMWPELYAMVTRTAAPDSPIPSRIVAMQLVEACADIAAVSGNCAEFESVLHAVLSGVSDESIRGAAIKALAPCITLVAGKKDPMLERFYNCFISNVLPQLLHAIQHGDDTDITMSAITVLEQLVDIKATAPLEEIIKVVLNTMMQQQKPMQLRAACGSLLTMFITQYRQTVRHTPALLNALVDAAMSCVCEDDSIYSEEATCCNEHCGGNCDCSSEEDYNHVTSCLCGGMLLAALSQSLPTKTIAPLVLEAGTAAQTPFQVKGFLMAIAHTAHGCRTVYRRHCKRLVLYSQEQLANGGNSCVREAAARALTELFQTLNPEVVSYVEGTTVALLPLLRDSSSNVRRAAAGGLEVVISSCPTATEAHLPTVMDAILESFLYTDHCSDFSKVREDLCDTIASLAAMESPRFTPYGVPLLRMLQNAITQQLELSPSLRAKLIMLAGVVGSVVGLDVFRGYIDIFVHDAEMQIISDVSVQKEQSYAFYARLCEMLTRSDVVEDQQRFVHMLPGLLNHITQSVRNCMVRAGHGYSVTEGCGEDENEDDDDNDDDFVKSDESAEVAAAVGALDTIVALMGTKFSPFLAQGVAVAFDALTIRHDRVRRNAFRAICHLCCVAHIGVESCSDPSKRVSALSSMLSLEAQELVSKCITVFRRILSMSQSKATVADACEAFMAVLSHYGQYIVHVWEEGRLIQDLKMLVRWEMFCGADDVATAGTSGTLERDITLLEAIASLVEAFAEASGPSFYTIFTTAVMPSVDESLEAALQAAQGRTEVPGDEAVAFAGMLANVLGSMQQACTDLFTKYMTWTHQYLQAVALGAETDTDAALASQCCFIMRILIECCTDMISQDDVNTILGDLRIVASNTNITEEVPAAHDNAASAAASVIRCLWHFTPLWVVAPTLRCFPASVDHDENKNGIATVKFLLRDVLGTLEANEESIAIQGEVLQTTVRLLSAPPSIVSTTQKSVLWETLREIQRAKPHVWAVLEQHAELMALLAQN